VWRVLVMMLALAGVAHAERDRRPAYAADIGLDLRALPHLDGNPPSAGHIDLYVLGQGDDVSALAPGGVDVEVRHVPGTGHLIVVFRARTAKRALRACRSTVKKYLARAPTLPLTEESGASLIRRCRRWRR
jgi:hypothetical protein